MEKRTAYLSLCVGLGLTAACSAVLGIKDFTPAKGDGGPGQDDGGPPEDTGSDVKVPGDGGDGMPPCMSGVPEVTCTCDASFQSACNGAAQPEQIICQNGTWVHKDTCPTGQNCDGRDGSTLGMCANIDPTCKDAGAAPNQSICTANSVVQCGPDLVSSTPPMWCDASACVNGACTGNCVPGAAQCAAHSTAQTCSTVGTWDASATCLEGCEGGTCTHFPSCAGGTGAGNDCGPQGDAASGGDCCASLEVPGGSFRRNYDMTTTGNTNPNYPAIVSPFRLDAYEVTVGRFRNFVSAVSGSGGWTPAAGSGKHSYLNSGSGLMNSAADAGGFEAGWLAAWNANLSTSSTTWNTNLSCGGSPTWTAVAGSNENLPISCVTWFEAYAFCIWDGGFLPSDAEWNFAASSTEQRVYPWSSPANSTTIDCAHANYSGCIDGGPNQAIAVGSDSPLGDGKFGQSDLSGNVWEWTLDAYAPLVQFSTCQDCANANITTSSSQVLRGGSYTLLSSALYSSYRLGSAGSTRDSSFGLRCARTP